MPIPKPRSRENQDDFLGRCMDNPTMNSEYPDQDQRMAVCGTSWRDSKKSMSRDDGTIEMDIFAVGKWNGFEFTIDDLRDFAASFEKLKDVHKVPLKFGHNNEQPMTDGQPALGWVTDVWVDRERGKLMARAEDVPEIVLEAIEKGRYRHVSIEADFGVEHKGELFNNVLSGVALLGADIPAVNTLGDLRQLMGRNGAQLNASRHGNFSAISGNIKKEAVMPKTVEELQAEIDALTKANENMAKDKVEFARKEAEFKAKQEDFEKRETERAEAEKKAVFERKKSDLTTELDELVKANKATPAQRDKLVKDMTEESIENVAFSVNVLKEAAPMAGLPGGEQGKGGSSDAGKQDYTDPTEEMTKRAEKFSRDNNVSLFEASKEVMRQDPKLAREYVDITGDGSM